MGERYEHLDGAALWAALPADQQAAIGAAAIEYVAGGNAVQAAGMTVEQTPRGRAAEEAWSRATDRLEEAVNGAVSPEAWLDEAGQHRVPSIIGPICRECGCSECDACVEGCAWAEPDLCTACVAASRAS